MQRVFFDMDGTLAEYQPIDAVEELYERGYFANLRPQNNVVQAAKNLIASPNFEVYVLSAVLTDSAYAIPEKSLWLDRYLPEVDSSHRIFSPVGESKTKYLPGGIRKEDILVDDYTVNLDLWTKEAHAVKILNGLNHTKGTWTGDKISAFRSADDLTSALMRISRGERIQDINSITVEIAKQIRKRAQMER